MCVLARACVRAYMCVCINISDVNLYICFQLAIKAFEITLLNVPMFQGELVFVKTLKLKDFEMKHALRQFIKQVRWISHKSIA